MEREDTGHPGHVNYRDAHGNLIGFTYHTPSVHRVTAYDVFGRSRDFTFEHEARDWIAYQFNTLGPEAIPPEDERRMGVTGRLIATVDSQELVTRRDHLQATVVDEMPPDVSRARRQAHEALEVARRRVAGPDASIGAMDHLGRLVDAYAQLDKVKHDRERWLDEHRPQLRELAAINEELRRRLEYRVDQLRISGEVEHLLGPAPGPEEPRSVRAAWRRAAETYAALERRHGAVDRKLGWSQMHELHKRAAELREARETAQVVVDQKPQELDAPQSSIRRG